MKHDSETAANQFGDSTSRPEVGGKAVLGWLLRQPISHQPILLGSEQTRPARRRFCFQARFAVSTMKRHPFGDSDARNSEGSSHGRLGFASQNCADCSHPESFQFASRSFASPELRNNKTCTHTQ
jgi:hypothetical protein